MKPDTLRRVIINLVTQTGTEIIGAIMGLVLVSRTARVFGPGVYGQYILAQSLAALFGAGVELGTNRILVRQIARSPSGAATIMADGLILRILGAVLTSVLLWIVALILGYSSSYLWLILIIWLTSCINLIATAIRMWFHGMQLMEFDAIIRVVQSVLTTVVGLVVLSFGANIELMAVSIGAVALVSFALTYIIAVLRLGKIDLRSSTKDGVVGMAKLGLPIFFATLFASISFKADSVMLSLFSTETEVGYYGAAYNAVLMLSLFSLMLNNVFFPLLSASHAQNTEAFQATIRSTGRYVGLLGLPMAFGLLALSGPAINLIYGPEFSPAILLMRIVSPALALMFLSTQLGTVCIALNQQGKVLPVLFIDAVVNVVMNLFLIPHLGAVGASIATTLTEFIGLVSYLVILRKELPLREMATDLFKTSLAVALMVAVLIINLSLGLFILIPLGAAVYFLAVWVIGVISVEDKERVISILQSWRVLYRAFAR